MLAGTYLANSLQKFLWLVLLKFVGFFSLTDMAITLPKLHILFAMIKAPFKNYSETCETTMGRIIIPKHVASLKSLLSGTLQRATMTASLTKKL